MNPATLPNADVRVTEEFLQANEVLLAFLAIAIFEGALEAPGATDWDLREALESLIKTWHARENGILYEARPENAFAASIAAFVQKRIHEILQKEQAATGSTSIPDSAILQMLVFMQRLEYANNNGRKRSRAFLGFLRSYYLPAMAHDEAAPEPDTPRIIL